MRCRRHPRWAGPGACFSCLRERLLVLAAERDDRCKSDAFDLSTLPRIPRSVSPYEPRRRSSACGEVLHHRYHRNHQAAPSACRGNKVAHFSFFSSSSWISSFLPGTKKKNSRLFSLDEEPSWAGCRKSYQKVHRGMSPVSDSAGMEETSEKLTGGHHQCPTAAIFGANRSRKLADFGKYS